MGWMGGIVNQSILNPVLNLLTNIIYSQVFDSNGVSIKEFGGYGSGEGEFDCLAGVAVNRIGQYIIADRYNHRIQVSCRNFLLLLLY